MRYMELIDNVENFYIFAGNLRVAVLKDGTPTYFHKDHLGSSSAMTDAPGNIIETAMYMRFGCKRGEAAISASSYKFTDQELDAESGLYNYDARLYDPVIGRFSSADSIISDWFISISLNRYAYCANNPLIFIDPNGHVHASVGSVSLEVGKVAISKTFDVVTFGWLYDFVLDKVIQTFDDIVENKIHNDNEEDTDNDSTEGGWSGNKGTQSSGGEGTDAGGGTGPGGSCENQRGNQIENNLE